MRASESGIGPFEIWGAPRRTVSLEIDGQSRGFTVEREAASDWRVAGEGVAAGDVRLKAVRRTGDHWSFSADGVSKRCRLVQNGTEVAVFHEGLTYRFVKPRGTRSDDLAAGGDQVVSMMPGIVKQVLVSEGQEVKSGEPMVIMEAMKMEMTLAAPRDGVVAEVLVSTGAQVADGVSLVRLTAEADAA